MGPYKKVVQSVLRSLFEAYSGNPGELRVPIQFGVRVMSTTHPKGVPSIELALNEEREGIIFIDEPELHLDPQWRRLILRSLRQLQPRAQLIVATHSPEIYDAAASYERHYLVPEDDPRSWLWAAQRGVESGV